MGSNGLGAPGGAIDATSVVVVGGTGGRPTATRSGSVVEVVLVVVLVAATVVDGGAMVAVVVMVVMVVVDVGSTVVDVASLDGGTTPGISPVPPAAGRVSTSNPQISRHAPATAASLDMRTILTDQARNAAICSTRSLLVARAARPLRN